jgi:CxxC motif-containing protein (DUF1111 family)
MVRSRPLSVSFLACLVLFFLPITSDAAPPNFGQPLAGLTAAQLADFNDGLAEFSAAEEADEGLGPVFNGRSCAECHSVAAIGGGSTIIETRFGKLTNGVFDPLTQFGGSLIQNKAIGPADGSPHQFLFDVVPAAATIVAGRRTTPLFGLGLVDATSDSTFLALALTEAIFYPSTAGKVALVKNIANNQLQVGRFGWKNQVSSLFVFSGDAYLNEMGITSPLFPTENCPRGNCAELAFNPLPGINDNGDGVVAFNNFMLLLAAPPPGPTTIGSIFGQIVFIQLGCDACHTATLSTGSHPIAALSNQTYHPYSDFLLHDMGTLGDKVVQGAANGREMRTAPLWGIRKVTRFLHDGRATTLDAAILAHDGQGLAARNRFNALGATDKSYVRAFLNSL